MGWISKQVRPTKEIFDDLVRVFGKKWNIAYMPSENGSPYEYFSDYIRDYYEVTLRQCDMLCKMIKEHYNIKTFYYNEVEAARNKKRIKVRITDKNRIFHEFEDKTATLDLGIGPSQALTSLSNLYALYDQGESDFNLQGYRFGVRGGYIFAYKTGPLEYSAGDFRLRKYVLARVMADLMDKKDLPLGDVRVVYSDKYAAYIYYDTYGFYLAVSFSNMTLPYTREYKQGDIVADDDLRLMIKAAQTPNAYRTKTAKTGSMVICKDQLIKACEAILNK